MLFADLSIPGLEMREDFIGPDEEQALIKHIEALGLSPFRFQGWTGKRLTKSFGWRYDFSQHKALPADPIPQFLSTSTARFSPSS